MTEFHVDPGELVMPLQLSYPLPSPADLSVLTIDDAVPPDEISGGDAPLEEVTMLPRAAADIARRYPTTSGVRLQLAPEDGGLMVDYDTTRHLSDEEVLAAGGRTVDDFETTAERNRAVDHTRFIQNRKKVGGLGVTSRPLKEINDLVPGIDERLRTEPGKIVFLGNGLSLAPLEVLAQRIDNPDIVIQDAFDYRRLRDDLAGLQAALAAQGMRAVGVDAHLARCQTLVDAIDAGRLRAEAFFFDGNSPLPDNLQGASLALNIVGPPPQTTAQQLTCLAPGGRLFTWHGWPAAAAGIRVYAMDESGPRIIGRQGYIDL